MTSHLNELFFCLEAQMHKLERNLECLWICPNTATFVYLSKMKVLASNILPDFCVCFQLHWSPLSMVLHGIIELIPT